MFFYTGVACSQTLYFLFKVLVRRVWVIINKPQGIYSVDRQRNGVVVGEEENRRVLALLANVFEKNENKNKTTVYRLRETSPERGIFLRVQVYQRVGIY